MSRKSNFCIRDITWYEVNQPHRYCLHEHRCLIAIAFSNGFGYQDTIRNDVDGKKWQW